MTLVQLLDLANQGYPDGFLAAYYDPETGEPKDGSGDTLALFIVRELQETFDPHASNKAQTIQAVRRLHKAQEDLSSVIAALAGQAAGSAKGDTRVRKPILVEFDYAQGDPGHFSEDVEATKAQATRIRKILERAAAQELIYPNWYVGSPQRQPTPFEEFLEQLRYALGSEAVDKTSA